MESTYGAAGIYNYSSGTVNFNSGSANWSQYGIANAGGTATVSGGTFANDFIGIGTSSSGTTIVSDGTFSGDTYALYAYGGGVFDVYGSAFSTGAETISSGTGSFSWTSNSGTVQTLKYDVLSGGSIDLIVGSAPGSGGSSTSTPEPSTLIAMAIGLVLLGSCCLYSNRKAVPRLNA